MIIFLSICLSVCLSIYLQYLSVYLPYLLNLIQPNPIQSIESDLFECIKPQKSWYMCGHARTNTHMKASEPNQEPNREPNRPVHRNRRNRFRNRMHQNCRTKLICWLRGRPLFCTFPRQKAPKSVRPVV